jgi:hypothetical protein
VKAPLAELLETFEIDGRHGVILPKLLPCFLC